MADKKTIIGREEWIALPGLNIPAIKARVDSGADTSSLHAFNIQTFKKNGKLFVSFDTHPIQHNLTITVHCSAEVVDRRSVKNPSGHKETRLVIRTQVKLDNATWEIEVTLANRDAMGYRMLLGREAMHGRVLVDPERSFCQWPLTDSTAKKLYTGTPSKTKGLKIAILASDPSLYSHRRLIEAGEQRGHEVRFLDIRQCQMRIGASKQQIYYRGGELLHGLDAVIPRIAPSLTFYGTAVLRQFQHMGVFCLNDAITIARSRDKLRSLQLLARKGIPLPVTAFASSSKDTKELIQMVGGAPLIVKLLEGMQGTGVVLAETNKAAESVVNAFKSIKAQVLVQEFIKEAEGRDIRCFVIDDVLVASMQREAAEGEFRANLHLGGTASTVRITPTERKIAVKAAREMGLKVAGVDLIRSKHGPKVLEVNSSPGLEGIETTTERDIAGLMIACIEKYVAQRQKKRAKD